MFIMTVSQTKTVEEEKCAFLILGFTVPLRIQNGSTKLITSCTSVTDLCYFDIIVKQVFFQVKKID